MGAVELKFVAVRDERRCRMDVWRSRILLAIDLTMASSWMLKNTNLRRQLAIRNSGKARADNYLLCTRNYHDLLCPGTDNDLICADDHLLCRASHIHELLPRDIHLRLSD